jgi:ComF family protein
MKDKCPGARGFNPRRFTKILFFLREYFFPSGCGICGSPLLGMEEAWYGLCTGCHDEIEAEFRSSGEKCELCGRPLISEKGRCLSCRNGEGTAYDRVSVLFPYTGKYRKLLKSYKFAKNRALGNFFAEKILESLGFNSPLTGAAENWIIVPVPPRPGKLKREGWDQVAYLAKLLKTGQGRLVPAGRPRPQIQKCLKRLRSTSQKELDRKNRKTNLKGRILLTQKPPEQVVILDDVITTGSTMDACASALKEGGARKVRGLCLFYD